MTTGGYARAWRFDDFTVDLAQRRAMEGERPLAITGRAFDVLTFLLEHDSRVVSKNELMAAIWPGLYVEENNLSQAISSLRRELGDSAAKQRYIATVPGRGFRFVGDVTVERVSGVPASLAVLPLKPLVPAQANAALEFGVAEALISRLGTIANLRVLPLSSAQRLASADPVDAGRALRADVVLDGRLQMERGRVRLTARLLESVHGTSPWAGTFDVSAGGLLEVQEVLANRVADSLRPELAAGERIRKLRTPTHDDEAWRLYLTGRFHWDRKTPEDNRRAAEAYAAALERDPEFALCHAGLADVHAVRAIFGFAPARAAFEAARDAAMHAVALDPALAEGHASLGHVLTQLDRNWAEGERLQDLALELKPTYAQATAWRAMLHTYRGQHREALVTVQRAQQLEPMSLSFAAFAGMLLYFAGEVSEARRVLERLVEAAPESPLPRALLSRALLASGEADAVIALLEGRERPAPGSFSNLPRAYAMAGRRADALAALEKLEQAGSAGFAVGFDLALVHVALGNEPAALDALERGVADGSQMIGYMNSEPALEPIRTHPRVRAVARALGLE